MATNRRTPNGERYATAIGYVKDRLYHRAMTELYPQSKPENFQPEDSVDFYFRILRDASEESVTICAIGMLTALRDFLRSEGAADLIRRKVRRLVTMAEAVFPAGADGFNWNMDRDAAAVVLADWPGEIVVSSPGRNVLTAAYLCAGTPRGEMVKLAYRRMGGGDEKFFRASWDLIAMLFCGGQLDEETVLSPECRIEYDAESGRHVATPEPGGKRRFLSLKIEPEALAEIVQRHLIAACAER